MTTESYTYNELDEFSGALLFLGGLHTAAGALLDATAGTTFLVEYLNHLPSSLVEELLPATVLMIDEVLARVVNMRRASVAALEYSRERTAENNEQAQRERQETREKFDRIMRGLD